MTVRVSLDAVPVPLPLLVQLVYGVRGWSKNPAADTAWESTGPDSQVLPVRRFETRASDLVQARPHVNPCKPGITIDSCMLLI